MAAKVLLEPGCMPGYAQEGGKKGKAASVIAGIGLDGKGAVGIQLANTGGNGSNISNDEAPTLDTGNNVAVAYTPQMPGDWQGFHPQASATQTLNPLDGCVPTLDTSKKAAVMSPDGMVLRRLTPQECLILQGFPPDHTMVPWEGKEGLDVPATHQYEKAGNSMAVPVISWLGERIMLVNDLLNGTGEPENMMDTSLPGYFPPFMLR